MSLPQPSDGIPRSYVDEAIRKLQKLVKHVKNCMSWQEPSQSVIAIATWWFLCLNFWLIVIYLLPLLPVLWVARSWSSEDIKEQPKQESKAHSTVLVTLTTTIDQKLAQAIEYLQWSKDPLRTRRMFIVLVYAYIFWVTAHQIMDTRHVALISGTVALAWRSPWFGALLVKSRYQVLRSVISTLLLGSLQDPHQSSVILRAVAYQTEFADADKRMSEDASFTFALYENQRSWPLGQWEAKTLPIERATWTDDTNEPVPPKNAFKLPSPIERTISDPNRPWTSYNKSWTWTWIDQEWRLDFSGQVDELAWEYGTMAWTMFDRQPKGFMSTRRRRWIRRARIEYHVEVKADPGSGHSSPAQSPTRSSFVMANTDPILSPPTSPRASSVFTIDSMRRDSFATASPTPRLSQSTTTVNGNYYPDMEEIRRRRGNSISTRSTGLYSSSLLEDRNRYSTTSLDKRPASMKKSPQRREAVWKSIVRT
ncbi:integral peroxisomal membrane peroxin-domain-containing protein [Fennellomyces sp. T-0311]|nr:integral peroxisomal membrane peroxin-domain-containing protein [Fennellomyces sp. T-0311]